VNSCIFALTKGYFTPIITYIAVLFLIGDAYLSSCTDYGVEEYDIGEGFGHFGIAVEDVSGCYLYNPKFDTAGLNNIHVCCVLHPYTKFKATCVV
jgi:hypothetical protein